MENKKKIEPLEGETLEEYIKRQQSRKGSPNRYKSTISLKEIYNRSSFKNSLSYKDFALIFNETCKIIRTLLVKGHSVSLPYFGTLETRYGERVSPVDPREIDFKKILKIKYDEANNIQNSNETWKHQNLPVVAILLTNKACKVPKISRARFCPQKYLVREIKNMVFGTNYYVHPY